MYRIYKDMLVMFAGRYDGDIEKTVGILMCKSCTQF